MPNIVYVENDGQEHMIDVPAGWSVMDGAVKNTVRGIDADCGGACACATCHVFVDQAWIGKLPAASEMETEMLALAEDVVPTSRLSCQIVVSHELDGLVVRMPESQH